MTDTFTFCNPAARTEWRNDHGVEKCGVEFAFTETDEVFHGFPLFYLHMERISPTNKALLTRAAANE